MSRALAKLARLNRERRRAEMQRDERDALRRIEEEVSETGVQFSYPHGARLRPSTVLGVLRRDEFKCRGCGGNEALTVDGSGRDFDSLCVICSTCLEQVDD